jgi:hypothetical protein
MRAFLLCAAAARLRLARWAPTPGNCEDNPDFKDKMGYPCSGWEGLDCPEAVESLSWVFDEEDGKEILRNCPKACNVCEALTTTSAAPTTTSTTAPPTTTVASSPQQSETNTTNATSDTNATNVTVEPLDRGWVNVDTRLSNGSVPALQAMPQVGAYVVRGPRWAGGTSDGGVGVVGRVTAVDEMMGTVDATWPNGRNHTYHLVDEELAAAKPTVFEPWAPLSVRSPAIGAQVRRGPAWTQGDADGGLPGTILDISEQKVTVEWASGLVEEYDLLGADLVLRADRTGVEKLLIKIWEDEMFNCDRLLRQEQHVIFTALGRKAAASTDAERGDADAEIAVAEAVSVEALAMYDLAAQHLETALHEASKHKAAVPGVVVDNSAKKNLTECHGRLTELEQVLDELLSPTGDFAVVAIQNGHRGPAGSETIHFRLAPELQGFGSQTEASTVLLQRCVTSAQQRERLASALQQQARRLSSARPAPTRPVLP